MRKLKEEEYQRQKEQERINEEIKLLKQLQQKYPQV